MAASLPRVRSQPLEAAITTIPYETVAAFMSKPACSTSDQIKARPTCSPTRDDHVAMSEGNTLYARGFSAGRIGTRYNVVRVGDALRDPDDNAIIGYNGIFTGSGHVTRGGDPVTLIMTESTRETVAGDKLFAGQHRRAARLHPEPAEDKSNGRIMAVTDGVTSSASIRWW